MSKRGEVTGQTVTTMPVADLAARVDQAKTDVRRVAETLPEMTRLTTDERRNGTGRLKGGEAKALLAVMAVAKAYPHLFDMLGELDNGTDPAKFEAEVIEQRLQRIELLASVAAEVEALQTLLADTQLRLGEMAKPVALRAYEIAKPLAAVNERVHTLLAPAIDFYGATARKAARTRAARRQAKEGADA